MRKQRGMTMIELVVYFALAIVTGLLLWSITNRIWNAQQVMSSSSLVSGETEKAIEWLRRDVNESALASLEVFPNASRPTEQPGMSLVSYRAFDPELRGKPLVNRWGAPQWDKHVLYTLRSEGSEGLTGTLVRWEKELSNKNYLPQVCQALPSAVEAVKQRVLLRDVLRPNVTVNKSGPENTLRTDHHGGFRVQFVRRSGGSGGPETLTSANPRQGAAEDNTRMLEAELKLLQNERSRPHLYTITFRMAARH